MGKNGFRLPFNVFLCQASLSGQLVHGDFGIFLDQGKVVVLLGSPRKTGNSSILSKEIAAGAESVGVVVESLFIKQMDIKRLPGLLELSKAGQEQLCHKR